MENERRIYGTQVEINAGAVQDLFDSRAKSMGERNPYTSVLLGDQNPEYAEKWNKFEKDYILPELNITSADSVLDIGCGIGRWAETLIPLCGYYCGADFSAEMIKIAKERNKFEGKKYDFVNCSFQEIAERCKGKKFSKIIISYICMYINDKDLKKCFESLSDLLDEHGIFYFTETVAIKERLTLKDFYSSAMKTDYSTIYRTPEEYLFYYKDVWGGVITKQGFHPHLNKEKEYSETDRWYSILKW